MLSVCFERQGQEGFVLNLTKPPAQLVEHRAPVREVVGSNPDQTDTRGL